MRLWHPSGVLPSGAAIRGFHPSQARGFNPRLRIFDPSRVDGPCYLSEWRVTRSAAAVFSPLNEWAPYIPLARPGAGIGSAVKRPLMIAAAMRVARASRNCGVAQRAASARLLTKPHSTSTAG